MSGEIGAVMTQIVALAAQSGLNPEEQARVEFLLSVTTIVLVVVVVGVLGLAVAIRYVAKRTTRPCPWCMEFVSKKESVCPRCGKPLTPVQ
jgi:heme/copper-type cytochrome/quinol oxidase subunit 2